MRRLKWEIITNSKDGIKYKMSHVMRLWYLLFSLIVFHSSNAHAQLSNGTRCLIFGRTLRLLPWFIKTEHHAPTNLIMPLILNKFVGYIENTRWVSFDIKFIRLGFENAYRIARLCRAILYAFSKPSLINLISKDASLGFYLSVYPFVHSLNWQLDAIIDFSQLRPGYPTRTNRWYF